MPEAAAASSYRIERFDRAVPDDAGRRHPVAAALATLLRWLCMGSGGKAWKDLSAGMIDEIIRMGLGIQGNEAGLSFSTALSGIGYVPADRYPDAMRFCGAGSESAIGTDHDCRFPWTLDMIVTCPRSRLMYKIALAHDVPIAVGLSITEAWYDLRSVATGEIAMPDLASNPDDGDCIVLDGWDDSREAFSCRFMAGSDWGDQGRGWIPYLYATHPLWTYELVMVPPV